MFRSNSIYTVPPGVTQLAVDVAGGGGGGGGSDRMPGGYGAAAPRIAAVLYVTPGEVLSIGVGGGGGAGGNTKCGGGGLGGTGWRSGGDGGRSGCTLSATSGASGGGGGGGGSSAILRGGVPLILGAGGGGGGGGSWSFSGLAADWGAPVALYAGISAFGTPGGALPGTQDGGGGGGGGAGCTAGPGGDAHTDGSAPTRAAGPGTSCYAAGAVVPGSVSSGTVPGSFGVSGNVGASSAGGPGYVAVQPIQPPAQPSAAHSSLAVTLDRQPADGNTADTLQATIHDDQDQPMSGVRVDFAGTPGVRFDAGAAGAPGACISGANGQCTVRATATAAAGHATQAGIGGAVIGTLHYSFVAGPANAGHSGLRILTDNAVADGVQADQLEFLVRDAFDNPANGVLVTIASPGADVSFQGSAAGSSGSCTTQANGICTISATSAGAAGGSKSSAVTVAGAALSGSFSAGGSSYGPSPAVFRFAPWVPRLQIVKQVYSARSIGAQTFVFTLGGLQSNSDSITVNGAGSASGAPLLGRVGGGPITITELGSAAWPEPPVSASCVDLASSKPGETFGSLSGSQLVIPIERSPAGADLRCTFVNARGEQISGRVFSDIGTGGGTANDGIPNGGEAGLPGMAVTLNDCGTTVYASTASDGIGNYHLPVPPRLAAGVRVCVDLSRPTAGRVGTAGSIGASPLPAGSAVPMFGTAYLYSREAAADRIGFQWMGSGTAGLNFGSVPASTFVQSASKTGRPGAAVQFAHLFTAGTSGSVSFSVAGSTATPPLDGWIETILADPGCSGLAQPGAAVLYPPSVPQTLAAGQTLCVLLRESIPAQAAPGSRDQARVHADFRLTATTPPLTTSHEVEDVTTVASEGVELQKEVRNVTQGSGFGLKNQARPGEVLEYRITYGNHTPVPVKHLVVSDSTPAYTGFVNAVADSTPAALGHCQKVTPGEAGPVDCSQNQPAGGKGSITWTFDGPLEPGASGTVLFRVQLE
ncbi:DUF11 domain-containing protein [Xylophilus rhododendri]|uniref:DUF11 domain-containing protein n=1 Tax=Xylophilus rhododendri TaxID=2697032 RepID=A0A857J6J9_9BURK|nr:Ig-like domain-containing protein [Xylophilus rhododendri]QHI98418.1 DUF11 domain-containing protein [Xylophilus rhododendri]